MPENLNYRKELFLVFITLATENVIAVDVYHCKCYIQFLKVLITKDGMYLEVVRQQQIEICLMHRLLDMVMLLLCFVQENIK